MKRLIVGFAAVVVLVGVGQVNGALTVYTDRSSWEAATASFVTEDFNGFTSDVLFSSGVNNAGLIDVLITGNPGVNRIDAPPLGPMFWSGQPIDATAFFLGEADKLGGEFPSLVFPYTIDSFGADWGSTHSLASLTMTVGSTTIVFEDYLPSGLGSGFLGVVSTTPFNQADFNTVLTRSEVFGMDNLGFGPTIPEPTTLAIWGILGAIGLAVGYRRRRA
jgi:hypothetical protein